MSFLAMRLPFRRGDLVRLRWSRGSGQSDGIPLTMLARWMGGAEDAPKQKATRPRRGRRYGFPALRSSAQEQPSAGIAPAYEVSERWTTRYLCDPHLDRDAAHRAEALQVPLFGETLLLARPQIELYQHEASWANRLILGDSLLMMNSLLVKEGMAARCR